MEKESLAIKNFKEMVMKVAADRLKRPLTESETSRIEKDIAAKSHILSRTPDHPPYPAMIHEAIGELNKESGSSEESISDFIKNKYPDLPLHHSECLKLYLQKQCKKKEIQMNSDNCYSMAFDSHIPTPHEPSIGAVKVHDQPEDKPVEVEEEEKGVGDEEQFMTINDKKPRERGRGRGRGRGDKPVELREEKEAGEEGFININEQKPRGRGRGRGIGRGNKLEPKEASTSDLIFSLAREKKNQPEQVRGRGLGRLRK